MNSKSNQRKLKMCDFAGLRFWNKLAEINGNDLSEFFKEAAKYTVLIHIPEVFEPVIGEIQDYAFRKAGLDMEKVEKDKYILTSYDVLPEEYKESTRRYVDNLLKMVIPSYTGDNHDN